MTKSERYQELLYRANVSYAKPSVPAEHQGTPGEGALRLNLPPEGLGYPPALIIQRISLSSESESGRCPDTPTAF